MNKGKYVFSQLLDFLDRNDFNYLARKYEGDKYVKQFTCYNQLARRWTWIRVNGWRMSCSGSLVTRTTAKPSVNSCPTSGLNKPTRINLNQLKATWPSCLQLEIKYTSRHLSVF